MKTLKDSMELRMQPEMKSEYQGKAVLSEQGKRLLADILTNRYATPTPILVQEDIHTIRPAKAPDFEKLWSCPRESADRFVESGQYAIIICNSIFPSAEGGVSCNEEVIFPINHPPMARWFLGEKQS